MVLDYLLVADADPSDDSPILWKIELPAGARGNLNLDFAGTGLGYIDYDASSEFLFYVDGVNSGVVKTALTDGSTAAVLPRFEDGAGRRL